MGELYVEGRFFAELYKGWERKGMRNCLLRAVCFRVIGESSERKGRDWGNCVLTADYFRWTG